MARRDPDERAERITIDAKALTALLKWYDGRDRIFALTEIYRLCQRDLAARESSQYHIDWRDEPPTDPQLPNIGDRKTRKVDMGEILRKKGEK